MISDQKYITAYMNIRLYTTLIVLLLTVFGCSTSTSQIVNTKQNQSVSLEVLSNTKGISGEMIVVDGIGGGIFTYKNKCISRPDGGKVIAAKDGGCWNRMMNNSSSVNVEWYGALADGVTDDTEAIQRAIDGLDDEVGGTIDIPSACKFYLTKLRFSQKVILNYTSLSDKSRDAGHTKAINEQYRFIANANKAGAVNEYVVAAPFHPGIVLDVRKDFIGQRKFLKSGQSYDNPVRASSLVRDEGMNQLIQQYQVYPDAANKYSGWSMNLFMNKYTLTGVGSGDFRSRPNICDIITNDSGTAKGNIISVAKSMIEVQWLSGRFSKGDKLLCNGQKSKRSIQEVKYKSQNFNSLTLNRKNGYMGVGLPHANAIFPLSIGGRLGIQSSRLHGQYLPENYKAPGIVFAKSFEDNSKDGVQILLSSANNSNRLILTDRESNPMAKIGAVSMHTGFNGSGSKANSSYNVREIKKIGAGDFLIIFANPCRSKNFQVGMSTSKPLEYAYVYAKEKDRVRIRIVKTGTDKLVNPTGVVSVICTGGDR